MGLRDWLRKLIGKDKITRSDLPVERVSIEPVVPFLPKTLIEKYRFVNPRFPREWLYTIEKAVVANPDLAQVLELIIDLGNTGHEIHIQGRQKEEALKEIESLATSWNVDNLINQLFAQIAIYGAISIEVVVEKDLSGVKKIVRVPPPTIHFIYNEAEDIYEPYQWIGTKDPIKLNPRTYLYLPLITLDGSPYGIPPFLSALAGIEVQEEFRNELKGLAKKLGLLGFLDVTFPLLPKAPNETEAEYQERARKFLEVVSTDVAINMSKGVFMHFEGTEAEFKEIGVNVSGMREIVELNEQWVLSGAKAQPSLLGRTTGSTETWASIAYEQFVNMLQNYQRLIKRALEYTYKLHLALKNYDVDDIDLEFNPLPKLNPDKDADVEFKRAQTVIMLYQAGLITLEEAREELGRDPKLPEKEGLTWQSGTGTKKVIRI